VRTRHLTLVAAVFIVFMSAITAIDAITLIANRKATATVGAAVTAIHVYLASGNTASAKNTKKIAVELRGVQKTLSDDLAENHTQNHAIVCAIAEAVKAPSAILKSYCSS